MSRAAGRWALGCAVAVMAAAGLTGCADEAVAEEVPDRLRIELGAGEVPVAELLRRVRRADGDVPPRVRVPKPEPPPPPPPRTRIVRLQPGETLGQLCERELGTSRRWREIMTLNGWSEAEITRLPGGQEVRLPVER